MSNEYGDGLDGRGHEWGLGCGGTRQAGDAVARRNQQGKNSERRAAKELDLTVGAYRPIDRGLCVERCVYTVLPENPEYRIATRFWRHERRTVDFAYIIQRREWESWINLARIDCSNHGSCHVHLPDEAPPTEHLVRLDTVEDLEGAMSVAQTKAREILRDTIRREAA